MNKQAELERIYNEAFNEELEKIAVAKRTLIEKMKRKVVGMGRKLEDAVFNPFSSDHHFLGELKDAKGLKAALRSRREAFIGKKS